MHKNVFLRRYALLSLLLTVAAGAIIVAVYCSRHSGQVAVPRPEAWPRADIPAPEYRTVCCDGLDMRVSAHALVTDSAQNALTIAYPRYDASIYLTVIRPGDDFAEAYRLRMRRIDLNLHGVHADAVERISPAGIDVLTVTARSASQTPIQVLLSSRDRGLIVSGTLFFNRTLTPVNADSVAPYIHALAADLDTLAMSLDTH